MRSCGGESISVLGAESENVFVRLEVTVAVWKERFIRCSCVDKAIHTPSSCVWLRVGCYDVLARV